MIDPELISRLQQKILRTHLYAFPDIPFIDGRHIEEDGRRRAKAVRLGMEAGYIGPAQFDPDGDRTETVHRVTDRAYQELVAEPINLEAIPGKGNLAGIINVEKFSDGEQKWLMENPQSGNWYVFSDSYYGQSTAVEGPLTLEAARQRYRELRAQYRSARLDLGVSNGSPREQAISRMQQQRLRDWENCSVRRTE